MAIKPFNYQQDFSSIDFRQHPELYQVGRGEQGVLLVEPYKSEILPYWRYKDEASAIESARKIYQLFEFYRQQNDFVGMDMARKFIQMGYTRARRYANYKGGKKYAKEGHLNSRGNDPVKAQLRQFSNNGGISFVRMKIISSEKRNIRLIGDNFQHRSSCPT